MDASYIPIAEARSFTTHWINPLKKITRTSITEITLLPRFRLIKGLPHDIIYFIQASPVNCAVSSFTLVGGELTFYVYSALCSSRSPGWQFNNPHNCSITSVETIIPSLNFCSVDSLNSFSFLSL